MKIAITGGRHFSDKVALFHALDQIHQRKPIEALFHGGASGADTLAHEWAVSKGVQPFVCPANWDFYSKGAGPIRNCCMLESGNPDLLVAVPGGTGTRNCVMQADALGIKVLKLELADAEFVAACDESVAEMLETGAEPTDTETLFKELDL